MHGKLAIALLGIVLCLPLVSAQQLHGPLFNIPSPAPQSSGAGFRVAFHGGEAMGRFHGQGLSVPYAYADYPLSNYAVGPAVVEAPQPQVFVVQVPSAAEPPKEEPPHALLIEERGDRYVRIGPDGAKLGEGAVAPEYQVPSSNSAGKFQAPAPALSPVVLIFRDGRRVQVHDYTIADGTIYVAGDYWTDGYWTKKIQLAALNLPATIKASQEQGATFVLPRFPNEVVVRP